MPRKRLQKCISLHCAMLQWCGVHRRRRHARQYTSVVVVAQVVLSKFGNCLICPREILMGGKVFSIKKFLPLCSLQSSTYVHTNIHTNVVRMLLCTDPLPVCSSSCQLDGRRWRRRQRQRQAVRLLGQQERQRGEARGFKATGLACLAHQSPGIKCEQSCSSPSSTQLPPL